MSFKYYQCKNCNCLLPKQNFNFEEHTCFTDIDFTKENIFVDNIFRDIIFRGLFIFLTIFMIFYIYNSSHHLYKKCPIINCHCINTALVENNKEGGSSKKTSVKKNKNKEDKLWGIYDEILIESVRTRPCLWNHTIPVKKSPLSVKEAWLEIRQELEGKYS